MNQLIVLCFNNASYTIGNPGDFPLNGATYVRKVLFGIGRKNRSPETDLGDFQCRDSFLEFQRITTYKDIYRCIQFWQNRSIDKQTVS